MAHETDYLVVGAGASGLAFADTLIAESDATVTLVDRRSGVGGHWRDAYPFIRLHLPSALYGVNSMALGNDSRQADGRNAGFYEQASGEEVCDYFDAVLARRLEASGRVVLRAHHDHLGSSSPGVEQLRDVATGEVEEVSVRRKVVDARYLEASIPATHEPAFKVSADASFAPINDLPELAADHDHVTVIGAGKTGVDACLWMLDHGIDPARIRWVRPRDLWFTDRAGMQPLDDVGGAMEGISYEVEAVAQNSDSRGVVEQLEGRGRLMRLDESTFPTRWVGTMLSRLELEDLRQITDVVRLGHVQSVEPDRLLLDAGEVATPPRTLHLDCSATGLNPNPPTPIFTPGRITVQNMRHNSPPFNAALLAFIEANREDDVEKNRLCPPNRYVSRVEGLAAVHCRTWRTEALWLADAQTARWISGSRLNILAALREHAGEQRTRDALARYGTFVESALARHPVDQTRAGNG